MLILLFVNSASASVISYKKDADGVTFKLDKGAMKIKICRADIIEVKYTIFNTFPYRESLVVNNKWITKTNFNVTGNNESIAITTASNKS